MRTRKNEGNQRHAVIILQGNTGQIQCIYWSGIKTDSNYGRQRKGRATLKKSATIHVTWPQAEKDTQSTGIRREPMAGSVHRLQHKEEDGSTEQF